MTTTAEKIKVMQAFENGAQIQYQLNGRWADSVDTPLWDWHHHNYRIKPPDPEPLECWATVNRHNEVLWYDAVTPEEPEDDTRLVRMREVTPQDEQDRLDAARLRWVLANGIGALYGNPKETYREIIDKAMQGGNE